MKLVLKILILFKILGSANFLFAQSKTLKEIESNLQFHLQKINYWSEHKIFTDSINTYDSIEIENKIFQQGLKDCTEKYPATLNYRFTSLQQGGLAIATSSDKKFRIYSWDTEMGGTMEIYDNIFQFRSNGNVFSVYPESNSDESDEGPDPKSWYEKIYSFKYNNKIIYLGIWNGKYSSLDFGKGIKLFTIGKNHLNNSLKLIRTKSGLQNELTYEYSLSSELAEKATITFDDKTKTIYFPLVNEDLTVTNKFIKYKFTGKYFEKIK